MFLNVAVIILVIVSANVLLNFKHGIQILMFLNVAVIILVIVSAVVIFNIDEKMFDKKEFEKSVNELMKMGMSRKGAIHTLNMKREGKI